jgi:hypothetical protein
MAVAREARLIEYDACRRFFHAGDRGSNPLGDAKLRH